MVTEAERKAKAKYRKKLRQFNLSLSQVDQDLIDHLETKDNVSGYLKELIRRDLESAKQG